MGIPPSEEYMLQVQDIFMKICHVTINPVMKLAHEKIIQATYGTISFLEKWNVYL